MNNSLIYRLNIWIAEQLKESAPNLYIYKSYFADGGLATFQMFCRAGILAFIIGLILGILLVITKKGGIHRNRVVYLISNTLINLIRAVPFMILMIFLVPYTRAIVGKAIDVEGAIMPLVFGAVPFYARQVEVALSGVEEGKIEAARSMGSGTMGLIFRVYLPEAVPALIRVTTVTAISLIGLTTMAGAVGAGGLGSFAINFGLNLQLDDIVNTCVVVLLIVTIIIQSAGNALSRLTFNRKLITLRHAPEAKSSPSGHENQPAEAAE